MSDLVLLVDVGNSTTKTASWSVSNGVRRLSAWPTRQTGSTPGSMTSEPWTGAVISSVAPADTHIQFLADLRAQGILTVDVSAGLVKSMNLVSGLYSGQGADRVANVIAMSALYPLPALCVDVGTAVTFDLVNSSRCFAGGLIAPGPSLMSGALAEGTARLPRIDELGSGSLLENTTRGAISSGCWWGGLALIAGILDLLSRRCVRWRSLIVTGGIGKRYSPGIPFPHIVDPDLTFKGMALVWEARNTGADTR